MLRNLAIILLALSLTACANSVTISPSLIHGKKDFESGYYKQAMKELLPQAVKGNAEAQYAVGYMYYYGYGVAQDLDVGYFWIKSSADQHFEPAMKAIGVMAREPKPYKPASTFTT